MLKQVPPRKPFKEGKISQEFGGPSTSALDVLERARVAISPRGAWSSSGWTSKNPGGHGRCLRQLCKDVDGKHVAAAELFIIKAIKLKYPAIGSSSIESFNDSSKTRKHDAILVLDTAIELAKKEA